TKSGNSFFDLVNTDVVGAGNISVATGTLALEGTTNVLDDGTSKITVHDGAMLELWNLGAAGQTNITRPIEIGDGAGASNAFMSLGGGNSAIGSNVLLK